ncbi:hypothetical protein ES708_14674 [subsurface metagenome]
MNKKDYNKQWRKDHPGYFTEYTKKMAKRSSRI